MVIMARAGNKYYFKVKESWRRKKKKKKLKIKLNEKKNPSIEKKYITVSFSYLFHLIM